MNQQELKKEQGVLDFVLPPKSFGFQDLLYIAAFISLYRFPYICIHFFVFDSHEVMSSFAQMFCIISEKITKQAENNGMNSKITIDLTCIYFHVIYNLCSDLNYYHLYKQV